MTSNLSVIARTLYRLLVNRGSLVHFIPIHISTTQYPQYVSDGSSDSTDEEWVLGSKTKEEKKQKKDLLRMFVRR